MVDQIERGKKENVGGGARGGDGTLFIYRRGEGRNQQKQQRRQQEVRPDWQRDTRTRIGVGMGIGEGGERRKRHPGPLPPC